MAGTIEHDAGMTAVRVDANATIRTAIPAHIAAATLGRKVLCGIRPEAIVPVTEDAAGCNAIRAEIEIIEPTGSDNLAYFRLGTHEALARLAPGSCNPGDRITLSLPPEKVLVYDAESQQLLA
jgi:multiple sugar transport system ATP-binding protein